jgi:hypothetical protein
VSRRAKRAQQPLAHEALSKLRLRRAALDAEEIDLGIVAHRDRSVERIVASSGAISSSPPRSVETERQNLSNEKRARLQIRDSRCRAPIVRRRRPNRDTAEAERAMCSRRKRADGRAALARSRSGDRAAGPQTTVIRTQCSGSSTRLTNSEIALGTCALSNGTALVVDFCARRRAPCHASRSRRSSSISSPAPEAVFTRTVANQDPCLDHHGIVGCSRSSHGPSVTPAGRPGRLRCSRVDLLLS